MGIVESNHVVNKAVAGDSNNGRAEPQDDNDNNEDEEDRPFTVEYATSSRATCRRCDAVILKGEIRISHVPLFRGKPGYRVYRHLKCAVFSEDIVKIENVGGWKKLNPADLEHLRQRIQESLLEIERENEDLDPDELVQKGFQGEIRETPATFVGTQLPFQIEGQSWMYNQEVHVPEIRGGILADEMGMVCLIVAIFYLIISFCTYARCSPSTHTYLYVIGENHPDYYCTVGQPSIASTL